MSRLACSTALCAAFLLHPAAYAQGTPTGVVTALYVEHAPGVFVAQAASPRHHGPIWAEIRGGRPGDQSRLFRVPEGLRLAPGDRVPVALAGQPSGIGVSPGLDTARAVPLAGPPCVVR